MLKKDSYNSIAALSEGLYKESGSRFLAFAIPVESEDDTKRIIAEYRNRFHDARHVCFAWRLGVNSDKWRLSDDGEPSGTAGRPIMGQIESKGVSDVLVIVVRYFGGILLGAPGLYRAYKTAAADALDKAAIVERTAAKWYEMRFGYESMPAVMSIIKSMDLPKGETEFAESCRISVRVRLSLEEDFLQKTENLVTLEVK